MTVNGNHTDDHPGLLSMAGAFYNMCLIRAEDRPWEAAAQRNLEEIGKYQGGNAPPVQKSM